MKYLALILLTSFGCFSKTQANSKIDTSQYVVLKYGNYKVYDNAKPATLSVGELKQIEALLNKALNDFNDNRNNRVRSCLYRNTRFNLYL